MTFRPPEHVARVLLYVVALNHSGYEPSVAEVRDYADSPEPQPARIKTFEELVAPSANYLTKRAADDVVTYLQDIGWITPGRAVRVTKLGAAVAQSLDESGVYEPQEAAVTVLNPSDPMRYEVLTRTIAAAGRGLLVDPYFKAAHLEWLTSCTSIRRVLVGGKSRDQKAELGPLGFRLATLSAGPVEVRSSVDAALHDRALLAEDRKVSILGTSLTGVRVHLSAVVPMPEVAAVPLADHYEALWKGATPVLPREGLDEVAATTEQAEGQLSR